MNTHQTFMQRALQLALNGFGKVSPNPMVGCVIVYDNKIIGEGYHQIYGGPHAEVNAINSVKDKSLLAKSTLFVTLEPCSHYGKTPPCANLIVENNIPNVVVCNHDPNPLVAGKGIQILKDAGIHVEIGVLEKEGLWLNRRFFTFINIKRPYIILKWAQTNDGFVARENYDSKWISSTLSRKLVHKWRTEEDSILVGKNTALYDNPQLTSRDWQGKNPTRIVIDKNLELSSDLHLFDQSIQTICFNCLKNQEDNSLKFIKIDFKNLAYEILSSLYELKIQSLIIEGGSATLNEFISQNLWDEARVFTSNNNFEKGIAAPILNHELYSTEKVDQDILSLYIKE